jgi:hypothetical protein
MRMQSGSLRQEAFLTSCPACSARNALNAQGCWRCAHELPPATADELIAALDALATERGLRRGLIGPDALRSPAEEPPRARRPAVARAAPVWRMRQQPPARQAQMHERFGLLVDGAPPPSSHRRTLRFASVGLAFVALVVAGYPVYRSEQRALPTPDLRHLPPPTWHRLEPSRLSTLDPIPAALGVNASAERTIVVPPAARPMPPPAPLATTIEPAPQARSPVAPERARVGAPGEARGRHEPVSSNGARPVSLTRHAPVHAQGATARLLHLASLRRMQARPVLVAGEVSAHDAALGR